MMMEASPSDFHAELVARPPLHPASFDKLDPARFDHLYLYCDGETREDPEKRSYRYRLSVVDRAVLPTTPLAFSTAVFLIPAGREAEYIFSSRKGLLSIAESAKCARLIAVAFGRSSTFPSQEFVQSELTYVVQVLSRQGKFLPAPQQKRFGDGGNIPFMANDGIGKRDVLASGETTLSGEYLVEQVKVDDQWLRRLYFMDNPFVIQTEVLLTPEEQVDKSFLAFDYHRSIVAGMVSVANDLHTPESTSSMCVIGLGGGGLVNFLQRAISNAYVTVVELDPSVVEVATKHFGLEQDDKVKVAVGDGLEISAQEASSEQTPQDLLFPSNSLSVVVVDVDSKDSTVGMSCPPASFCTVEYLTTLKTLLKPDGSALLINVSARDPAMASMVFRNAQTVFGSVFVVKADDDEDNNDDDMDKSVNVVLLATSQQQAAPCTELIERHIETIFANSNMGPEMLSDLKLNNVAVWNDDSKPKTAASGGSNAKNKKKKKGKKGKRK